MLDIIITSSSRPQLYPFFWDSVQKMLISRGHRNIYIHEDFIFKEESQKVVKWVQKNIPGAELYINDPPLGLGFSIDAMLTKCRSKYILYLQEDWEFERPIDLDQLMWVMDKNLKINLIFFNKMVNLKMINGSTQPEYEYNGVRMCLSHQWTFLPGLWRTDFVKKYWRTRKDYSEGYFTNAFGNHEQRMDVNYCEKNIGAYMLGKSMDWRYARHIGNDMRMERWQMEDGKPGGCHDDKMDLAVMPPWVKFTKRPIRKLGDIKDILYDQPKEFKEFIENYKG